MVRNIPRLKENVPGRYYVDIRCIGCMLCSELAPDVFRPGGDETDDYNYRLPDKDFGLPYRSESSTTYYGYDLLRFLPLALPKSLSETLYVHRQPSARREEELCAESMRLCPVDAIGDEGE